MFYNPWMPQIPYFPPQPTTDPIAQTKAFLDFISEYNEKTKKNEKKEDKKPQMNWAQSMLFLLFVMPIVGIGVSAFQFYVFANIFQHLR